MNVTLQILSPIVRKAIGWNDGKFEESFQFQGDTIGDLLKAVCDHEGKSLYERFMEDDGMISRTYIHLNGISYLRSEDLQRVLKNGEKLALLGNLACCGGG
ncbi:MAG TPA: hypothetical protein PK022_02940 [Syntrophales bacterium]|nr:hypothetical protein [Syntrophales bacterium]